jgi:hypothetical protein
MTQPHIKVMTPCHGGQVSAYYAASLLDLVLACQQRGVRLDWHLSDGGTDIALARENCVAAFLEEPEPTHFLFIDADIGFAADQVFRLLDFDAAFTAAAYPIKMLDWDRITTAVGQHHSDPAAAFYYAIDWDGSRVIEARNGFARAPYVGMGFVLIQRSALVRLAEAYAYAWPSLKAGNPVPVGGKPNCPGLFAPMIEPGTGRYLSECFAFCRRWTDLGGQIWVDVQSKLTHVGPIPFRGDLFSQLEPIPETAAP